MYLRPRSIFEKLIVEEKLTRVASNGRVEVEFKATSAEIFGVIASAEPHEREKFKSLKHEITHTVIQKLGHVKAKVGDRLVKEDKKYLVKSVDNPAGLGQFYIYYVEERNDL